MRGNYGYLFLGIIFTAFSIIAFAMPFPRDPVFWISYSFGIGAIAFQIPLLRKAIGGKEFKSKFLGFSALLIGATYLIIQLAVSMAMMVAKGIPSWAAIITDVVILFLACILTISGDAARTMIATTERNIQADTAFMKGLKANVEILRTEEADPEVKKSLDALTETIKYSDPMSSEELRDIEQMIAEKVETLSFEDSDKISLISEIDALLKQRNIRCKSLK